MTAGFSYSNPAEPGEPFSGKRMLLAGGEPLALDSGAKLGPVTIAYETYGELNADRSNAILICHALTGDQFVVGQNPVTGRPGWWPTMVGPGKPVDTSKYFVICSNLLGGCMGSTGPQEINPETGSAYALDFPVITVADMVHAQVLLINQLGIETLFAIVGPSVGGMQALQWAASHPLRMRAVLLIATAPQISAQNIAFHEVGRQAILNDPEWHQGQYAAKETRPAVGMSVARMSAHITYLSKNAMERKFGRNLQDRDAPAPTYVLDAEFQVESYLRHQGNAFVERFDANSYLYVTRATDYFDLAADFGGNLSLAFATSKARFLVIAFSSDWLFPPEDSRQMVVALNMAGAEVSFAEIETDKGHDAFLLDEPEFYDIAGRFLEGCASVAATPNVRPDLKLIADLIEPGSRVLDVGSGDGALLAYLAGTRGITGKGLEISRAGVGDSVARGLSVIHGDANRDLRYFQPGSFDYAVLSRTLQSVQDPRHVLEQLIRIGGKAIVSFDNFGYWRTRRSMMLEGRNPIYGTGTSWWQSDVIHPFTISDFLDLANSLNIKVEQAVMLDRHGRTTSSGTVPRHANIRAAEAVFVVSAQTRSDRPED